MAQYSQEQMIRLMALSGDVLMATLLIDRNDNIGTMREFRDGIKYITNAKNKYPRNALIQNMIVGADKSIQEVQAYTVSERQEAVWAYQNRIDATISILANDEEAKEFQAHPGRIGPGSCRSCRIWHLRNRRESKRCRSNLY